MTAAKPPYNGTGTDRYGISAQYQMRRTILDSLPTPTDLKVPGPKGWPYIGPRKSRSTGVSAGHYKVAETCAAGVCPVHNG